MSKKYVKLIIVAVAAIVALLGVVAFDWMAVKVSVMGVSESTNCSLAECEGAEVFGFMNAFAVISYIVALATAVVYAVNQFVENDTLKKVQKYLALAAVIVAIILVVALMLFCIKNTESALGVKMAPWWGIGAYLTVAGTAVAGIVAKK